MKLFRPTKTIAAAATVAASLFLTACAGGAGAAENAPVTELRIGIQMDETDPERGAASETFRAALEYHLGLPVTINEDMSYLIAIESMRAGNLDMTIFSAFNYVRAASVVDLDQIATVNMSASTDHIMRPIFITRVENEHINSLADLEGATFAFVDATSTSGYIFPKFALVTELGLDPDQLMNSGYFFNTAVFSGSHNASVMGVNFGDFDAAVIGGEFILAGMAAAGVINLDDFKIIGEAAAAPDPSWVARASLPAELRESIREFMLQWNDDEYFINFWGNPAIRYIDADRAGFEYVRNMLSTLGLNAD